MFGVWTTLQLQVCIAVSVLLIDSADGPTIPRRPPSSVAGQPIRPSGMAAQYTDSRGDSRDEPNVLAGPRHRIFRCVWSYGQAAFFSFDLIFIKITFELLEELILSLGARVVAVVCNAELTGLSDVTEITATISLDGTVVLRTPENS